MILSSAKKTLTASLTILGVLPFVLAVIFFQIDHDVFLTTRQAQDLIASYAVVIVVFLSGVHWGQAILSTQKDTWWLLLLSNLMTLLAWLGLFFLSYQDVMFLMGLQFILLLIVDIGLFKKSLLKTHYIILRIIISVTVVFSCFLLGWIA